MNKIPDYQLTAVLLLSGAWSVICMPVFYGNGQIPGTVTACLMQILLCIPVLTLQPDSFRKLVTSQKWAGILYILFFLLCGANGFSQLWESAPPQLLPDSGKLTASVLIALTCFYTSSSGLRTTARVAPVVMSLFLISFLVLFVGAWKRADFSRLSFQTSHFFDSFRIYFSLSGELTAVWILTDPLRNPKTKAVHNYLILKALFCICILGFGIVTGGRLISLNDYPFFTLTALSQPLQGQRADALYILVFVMLHIMHTTLQTGIIEHIAEMLSPLTEKWSAPVSFLLMLILAFFFHSEDFEKILFYTMPVLFFVIPLILKLRHFSGKETIHEIS